MNIYELIVDYILYLWYIIKFIPKTWQLYANWYHVNYRSPKVFNEINWNVDNEYHMAHKFLLLKHYYRSTY